MLLNISVFIYFSFAPLTYTNWRVRRELYEKLFEVEWSGVITSTYLRSTTTLLCCHLNVSQCVSFYEPEAT